MSFFSDFIHLFYPKLCVACGNSLFKDEKELCLQCIYNLPKTNYHTQTQNPIEKLFWGRVSIDKVTAFYFFKKDSKVQNILHELKYDNNQEIGELVGELYGNELVKADWMQNIDVIIPVPLGPKKQRIRGYNQSECFAKGLSKATGIKLDIQTLIRNKDTETQTRKSRIERWQNVETIFEVVQPENIENMTVLLVDDVVTTGATLEACANKLLAIKGVNVSIATIAFANL